MNELMPPESLSEFGSIWLFYVVSWGLVCSIMAGIPIALIIAAVSVLMGQLSKLPERFYRFGLLLLILLPVGGVANALWCCLVFGNFYTEHDIDSPEDDFSPFYPIDSSSISMQHGHLLTCTIPYLQFLWFLFAALSWSITFLIYRFIRQVTKKLILRQAQDDGDASANLAIP